MNYRMVSFIVGCVLEIEAVLMLAVSLVSLGYHESSGWMLVVSALIGAAVGGLLILLRPRGRNNNNMYAREGFVGTALSWLAMSAVGALPFWLSGQIPNYLDALFETVSGFTTTGASILTNVEAMDHGLLFWRSFTHWVGGMGVLVFMLAVLPLAGGQNLHLMRAESPGPSVGKLVPRLRSTAIWLYGIYLGISVACFLLLVIGRMPVFDAACLTFGTAGTGGFGVLGSSFADYNLYCKIVTTVFMLMFGMNFNFYYLLLIRKFRDAFGMEEIRCYVIFYAVACGLILLNLMSAGTLGAAGSEAIDVFFSVSSVMTTTGYATADFNLWPTLSRCILVMIMFTGGCAGSTGGGLKVSRWVIFAKGIRRELHRLTHPRAVRSIHIDGKVVDESVIRNTFVYMSIFVLIYALSMLVVCLDGKDLTSTFTAVAATINNIGPGLNAVGPVGNYADFSWYSKCVLIFDMLAGRLEIFPLVIFLMPSTWSRHHS